MRARGGRWIVVLLAFKQKGGLDCLFDLLVWVVVQSFRLLC